MTVQVNRDLGPLRRVAGASTPSGAAALLDTAIFQVLDATPFLLDGHVAGIRHDDAEAGRRIVSMLRIPAGMVLSRVSVRWTSTSTGAESLVFGFFDADNPIIRDTGANTVKIGRPFPLAAVSPDGAYSDGAWSPPQEATILPPADGAIEVTNLTVSRERILGLWTIETGRTMETVWEWAEA